MMQGAGRIFIVLGIVLILIGLAFVFSEKIPYIGRLPGDIYVKKERFTFYFPITTGILISIILTILFSIFKK
jgi:hypothetical protein